MEEKEPTSHENPSPDDGATVLDDHKPAAHFAPGRKVGHYTIRKVLGAGGMGVVYEAEQEAPRRIVALKVIRAGVASPSLLRRFEHEAQILGKLDHPGIATIYEAGTFDAGAGPQPFFAMELVRGQPLTEYAHDKKLGTRQRLELLARIAEAVHHAHQKGVIHRDLKPGNILVTDDGQVKILDFGVARATDADTKASTLQTDIGQLLGTIPYMSPEQAAGDPDELDTRSDVYALGVVAYELLAGRLPYDIEEKMIHEAVRVIREDDPTPLSAVNRVFRGDIEIIIGKALQKEKDRRYQSASDFASDIHRYLSDEPIVARPPSTWYQLSKFSKRNKALVGGVAATFVVLVAGIIATSVATAWALDERTDAVNARNAETSAKNEVIAREKDLEKRNDELLNVSLFQANQLSDIDAELMGIRLRRGVIEKRRASMEGAGRDAQEIEQGLRELEQGLAGVNFTNLALDTLDENIFERAITAIEKNFVDQPLVRARLLQSVATTLLALGILDQALTPQSEALELRREHLGNHHPDTLSSINHKASLLLTKGDLTDAESLWREGLALRNQLLSDEDEDTLNTVNGLSKVLALEGRFDEAKALCQSAIETSRRVFGNDHRITLASVGMMAYILREQGNLAEAESFQRELAEGRRRGLGETHLSTMHAMSGLAGLFREQGKFSEAEPYERQALQIRSKTLGDEHPDSLSSMNALGALLLTMGRITEAEPLLIAAIEGRRRVLGAAHPDTLVSINNLGNLYSTQGDYAQALARFQEAHDEFRLLLGPDHPFTIKSLSNLGSALRSQGRLAEAESRLREALDASRRVLGDRHPSTFQSANNLGAVLYEQGRWKEAEPFFREALDRRRESLGEGHLSTLVSMNNLGALLRNMGELDEAESLGAEVVLRGREALPPQHWANGVHLMEHARTLARMNRFEQAEKLMMESLDLFQAALGAPHPRTVGSIRYLADLYDAWNAAEPDKGYDAKAAEWRAKLPDEVNSNEQDD